LLSKQIKTANGDNPMNEKEDIAFLRQYEPIIRYTRGEQFFPIDVEPYVRYSSLWMRAPRREAVCLVPEGELNLNKLCNLRTDGFGTVYYMKFIEPLNITELASYRIQQGLKKKDPLDVFRAGRGRLARVGYFSRFIDALFSLSLFARGRVPGDTAAAAGLAFRQILQNKEEFCYYGRVIRQNGWTILQYWFFYPFNNWRSGFYGANDHEADWEMICVYLAESSRGDISPEWVAYASHDFSGDDLRRRWDDPEFEKIGDHPVVYSGAGSHASYFTPGDYLTEIELPFLSPLVRLVNELQSWWRSVLRQTWGDRDWNENPSNITVFRVPFVDYARGDGVSIGPGCDQEWGSPQLFNPPPDWLIKYRGLWGLYTRDPVAGENAPAGPVYNREGSIRRSWYDPLGWSGLDKVPPREEAIGLVHKRCEEIEAKRNQLARTISAKSEILSELWIEAESMLGHPHMAKHYSAHQEKIDSLSEEIKNLRSEYAEEGSLLVSLGRYSKKLQRGEPSPLRGHLHRFHKPTSDASLRLNQIAEIWAAISTGLMMMGFVAIVLFAREYLLFGLISIISILVFVEAGFRRRLAHLISSLTIGLAFVSAFILIYEFFWEVIVLSVILAGGYIMWENIKELYT
jgi:hypothetical protein